MKLQFNPRVFNYKFMGPPNTLGARVKIQDKYFGKSVVLPFCYETGNAAQQAANHLKEIGFIITGFNDEYQIIIVENWDSHIQLKK